MILELKAVFKDEEKAYQTCRDLKMVQHDDLSDIKVDLIDGVSNLNELTKFNTRKFYKHLLNGMLIVVFLLL